jgi:hypothetical protein
MALAVQEQPGGRLLVFHLSGKLTAEDYEHFTPCLAKAVMAHGRVRVLVLMHHFHGRACEVQRPFPGVERLAVVGVKLWEAGMATFCASFVSAAVRYFDESESDEAEEWISDGIEPIPARATVAPDRSQRPAEQLSGVVV